MRTDRSTETSSELMAFPGVGFPTEQGRWRVMVAGVVWQTPVVFSKTQRMMIRMLGNTMKVSSEELACRTFLKRITPFVTEGKHRVPLSVFINGKTFHLKKKTRKNGHFRELLSLAPADIESATTTDAQGNRKLVFQVGIGHDESKRVTGSSLLLEREGTSVISDIDDTIKISNVGDRRQLLINTFLNDFDAIEGMPELYQHWSRCGAAFHYVSSSPWQLLCPLVEMNERWQFPEGSMHLRNFRLRDQLLKKIIFRRQGKATSIRFLLKHLPQRKFVLVGDSGEKDPEIYRKISLKFPGQVRAILIREVAHGPFTPERHEKIRRSIPHGIFKTFRESSELRDLTERLFNGNR